MRKLFTRPALILFGACGGAAAAGMPVFGVVLGVIWIGNGGELSPEMGGGFELFWSALAGIWAGLFGGYVGGWITAARLPREPSDDGPPDPFGPPRG